MKHPQTFFSESFALVAKGGGMKDGTYLQEVKLELCGNDPE